MSKTRKGTVKSAVKDTVDIIVILNLRRVSCTTSEAMESLALL